jgi:hypothetical protein
MSTPSSKKKKALSPPTLSPRDTSNKKLPPSALLMEQNSSKGKDMDLHNDLCQQCGIGGDVLCCDFCNVVYHMGCLTPKLSVLPEGKWGCPVCVQEAEQRYANQHKHKNSSPKKEKKGEGHAVGKPKKENPGNEKKEKLQKEKKEKLQKEKKEKLQQEKKEKLQQEKKEKLQKARPQKEKKNLTNAAGQQQEVARPRKKVVSTKEQGLGPKSGTVKCEAKFWEAALEPAQYPVHSAWPFC